MVLLPLLLATLTAWGDCPRAAAVLQDEPQCRLVGQMNLADPFIYLEGDTYYAFGTESNEGFRCYSSTDLEHWEQVSGKARDGFALHREDCFGDRWFWAPEVYRLGGRYFLLYSAQERPCIAVADDIAGPYKPYGQGVMTDDPNGIDNTLFIDEDGTVYMYWVRWGLGKGNEIRVAVLSDDMTRVGEQTRCIWASEPWELVLGRVTEAPTVLRIGDTYYMTYSANDFRSQDYAIGLATAPSPLGPWTKYPGNPVLRRPGGLYGTGHSSIFRDKEGRLRLVFHAHASSSAVGPRKMYITAIEEVMEDGRLILKPSGQYITPFLYSR